METETPSNISPERQKWEKVFGTLVNMLQTQQQQLQSLVDERKLLQDRFKDQHDHWVSDVEILESQAFRMKREASLEEKGRYLEMGKSQLLDSLNRSKSLICNLKLEYAESDLVDLWSCFELLYHKLTEYELSRDESKEKGKDGNDDTSMADELMKLKRAYDNLESKHTSDISALSSEKAFVWNQFINMENECTTIRKSTQLELEQANEKIHILMTNTEHLQSSNTEKDEIISKLKSDMAKLEADRENKNREISRLSKEVEQLKNSRGAPQTPVPNSCTTRARAALKTSLDRRSLKKEASSSSRASEKDSRGSKRKEVENIPIPIPVPVSETPKLFSSNFRVPKLKTASPCKSAT